jgi:hypothetical protein
MPKKTRAKRKMRNMAKSTLRGPPLMVSTKTSTRALWLSKVSTMMKEDKMVAMKSQHSKMVVKTNTSTHSTNSKRSRRWTRTVT